VRPGIDGVALIQRQWNGGRPEDNAWFEASPLNVEIDEWGSTTMQRPALINARKLQFCGQFAFRAQKPQMTTVDARRRRLLAASRVLPGPLRRTLRKAIPDRWLS
jgi:hypothetical protein